MPLCEGSRVLVVDDDPDLIAFVVQGLAESELDAEGCNSRAEADKLLAERRFDCVLLDVMLGEDDGRELLSQMRAGGDDTPVIMVSARGDTDDRVAGLQLGADDYIVKPFSFSELLARIQAVLRRKRGALAIGFDTLSISPGTRKATCHNREIDLSPREFDLLMALVRARGVTVSRAQLLQEAWGIAHDPGTNVVDVHIARIRRKLKTADGPAVTTVRGQGYRLDPSQP